MLPRVTQSVNSISRGSIPCRLCNHTPSVPDTASQNCLKRHKH